MLLFNLIIVSLVGLQTIQCIDRGRLLWSDEFDYVGIPSANEWTQETGGHGWGNNELQYYTTSNAAVFSNHLTIFTRRENYQNNRYTSARLISKRPFKYGVIEARVKIPSGRGTWPAFWLLGANRPLSWPADGEIDVLEHVGYDPGRVHANIHCSKYNHVIGTNKGNNIFINNIYAGYHTYTVDWNAHRLKFYVDDVEYFSYYKHENTYAAWPFDNPHNILLNTAVGGDWGGAQGVDDTIFPQEYSIDYVRQYENNTSDREARTITIKSKSTDKFVSADDYGFAPLIANRDAPDGWETFKLVYNNDGTVSIWVIVNALFVSIEDPNWAQAKKGAPGQLEKFNLVQNADGSTAIRAVSNGKYIRTRPWPAPQLIADSDSIGDAQSFYINYV